jgi:7-carboxy-7-deazaguanine synthase
MTTDWNALEECVRTAKGETKCSLKIVVFDEADYAYARTVALRAPTIPIYLQVGNPAPLRAAGNAMPDEADFADLLGRLRWLVDRVVTDRWFDATVLPQLHVLAWGNKRGV